MNQKTILQNIIFVTMCVVA